MQLLKTIVLFTMVMGLVACGGGNDGSTAEETEGSSEVGGVEAETPVEEAPPTEITPEETPAEETPAEETPAEETPAEETPAEETPAEETPAEETPAEETPAEETPADEAPGLGNNEDGDFNSSVIDLFDFLLNDNLEIVGGVDEVLVTIFDGATGAMIAPPFTQIMTRVDEATITTRIDGVEVGAATLTEDAIEEVQSDEDSNLATISTDLRFVEIGEVIFSGVDVTERETTTTNCSIDERFISFNISAATDGLISATPNSFSDVIRLRCEVFTNPFDPSIPASQGTADNYYARGVGVIFFDSMSSDSSGASLSLASTYERLEIGTPTSR